LPVAGVKKSSCTIENNNTLEAKERNNSNNMSNPVVVQGTPVQNPHSGGGFASALESGSAPAYSSSAPPASNDREGKKESSCNDPIFAVLFYVALVAICAVAGIYGPDALNTDEVTDNGTNQYDGYMILTAIIVCISFLGAGAGMALLFWIPQFLIKTALIFTVVMCKSFVLLEDAQCERLHAARPHIRTDAALPESLCRRAESCRMPPCTLALTFFSFLVFPLITTAGLWAAFGFVSGAYAAGVVGLIFFAITCCYAYMVWSRIPFATANLVTACTAIRANLGVAFYAYIFAILAGAWSIVWALALMGVFDQTYDCDENNVCTNPSYGLLFLLFLAYFFVQQVIQVRDTGCIRKFDRGVPWIRSTCSRYFLVSLCFLAAI